jgi:hypothetical protein
VSPVTNEDSGSDMDISTEGSAEAARTTQTKGMQANELLLPPIIKATGHIDIATGATTELLRKQNKQQRTELLLLLPIKTQWEQHRGETLLPGDHWEHRHKTAEAREMAPQTLALEHEAATILEDWEKFGCPTKTGRDWTLNEIQAAIDRGPHKSALEPEAIAHFAEEVADKVKKGQARVVL